MPLYVQVLGFKTDNVTTTRQRDDVRRVFDHADHHTDETLCAALSKALSEYPAVRVWCLTILDRGTVSVFDSDLPGALLHRVTSESSESIAVSFEPPLDQITIELSKSRGFAELELRETPAQLIEMHESFSDAEGETTLNFPTWFDNQKHLDAVLASLAPLVRNTVATFTLIDRSFIWVELGPGRTHTVRMLPRTSSPEATAIVQQILNRNDPFPGNLERLLPDWVSGFTGGSAEQFRKACRRAKNAIDESSWNEEAKIIRRELVAPVAQALTALPIGDPRRQDLWEIACWLRAAKIRAVTIEALKLGDPALSDAHIDRQRDLVFKELPQVVEEAHRMDPTLAWIPRAVRILAQYDLAKPEWPR